MSYYADLKIKRKLMLGFFSIVSMTLTLGLFSFFQIHRLEKADIFLYEKAVKPVEHIGDISATFQRLRVNIRELVLAKNEDIHDHYISRVATFSERIETHVKLLENALPDDESKRLFAQLVKTRNEFSPYLNQIGEFTKAGEASKAIKYIRSDAFANAERVVIEAIEEIQEYLVANAEKVSVMNSDTTSNSAMVMLCLAIGTSLLAAIMTILITRSVANPIRQVLDAIRSQRDRNRRKVALVEAIAGGDLDIEVTVNEPLTVDPASISRDEAGMLLTAIAEMSEVQFILDQAFAEMASALRHKRNDDLKHDRLKNGQNELNIILRGDKPIERLTEQVLVFLTEFIGAGVGAFYIFDEGESVLKISSSYALTEHKLRIGKIALGEGLTGQAALEKRMICLDEVPPDYLSISSGLGGADPGSVLILPLIYNNALIGVLEFGSFAPFSNSDQGFLDYSKEGIAIALSINKSRQLVNELLEQTQGQAEELRVQQEELQQTNEELEERAQMLEQQREQIRVKNREIEDTNRELQRKADELERVSTYKSEFLANMSHELRTPLNSLMILSSLLRDNREGNLSAKQVEFAATINGAGRDLLNLINDILDLSKIESGHMDYHYSQQPVSEIGEQLQSVFNPIAGNKDIAFRVTFDDSAPESISVDSQRVLQILKNLLSNACKFTSHGSVLLNIYSPDPIESPLNSPTIAFAVSDTGIGIPVDKQSLIFNAFQQADGSTSRTYGGTGLGLSISRQLARAMGGDITLSSETGKGSTFTLFLPVIGECAIKPPLMQSEAAPVPAAAVSVPNIKEAAANKIALEPLPSPIPDDREMLQNGDKCILVIEDDLTFAKILADMVRNRRFAVLVAADGETGIALAERYQPSAIILDIMLPHIDGWGVMRCLKDNPDTRHIPVHFITCLEERQKAMGMGAIGFVTKPVSSEQLDNVFGTLENAIKKTVKMLLIVEDNQNEAKALVALLEERNVTIKVAESGNRAIQLLSSEQFDCIVLDLGLADMGAFELLEELKKLDPEHRIPVIIHTGREITHEDEKRLHHYAESIIIKGAKSPERLLNEVTLFLHLVETSLDPGKQRMIRTALDKEAMLEGKKVLIVDDDMRNIFSLSSALAEKNIVIFEAENGLEALKQLEDTPDIDLVLMDIMMPEMDGYEAMRRIRKNPRFNSLPIIALTAKAMKGDREDCLKAGASDYIPKPVDMEKLFSLLRVWLYSAPSTGTVDIG